MAFLPKVIATAVGIAAYEVVLRPLVVDRTRPASEREREEKDDFLDEDWESESEE
ncbi:MAG: hypothetical protein V3R34_06155 [Hyphomicrobium sp.]